MVKQLTRQQAVRRGRWLRRSEKIVIGFRSVFSHANKRREEVFIDTGFGRVRALCYGFEEKATQPLFIDLHGGGFILGGPEMDEELNLKLLDEVGCKVISLDYAKAPDQPYPAAVDQVFAVAQQLVEQADDHGIDPTRVAIGGHSAGANLSTVACMQAKAAGRFQFACQVLDYPPLDLATDPEEKPQPEGAIPPNMAHVFNACYVDLARAREAYASPIFATQEQLTGLPPTLMILAGGDSLHDEGLRYGDMLASAGVEVECHDYPDAPHGFSLHASKDAQDAQNKMAVFLRQHLQ